ncbi:hypothetical protein NITHO_3400016 [Nitrolancea hollandica Lb]|uniref:Uncharacterized protein n=1 Tax=Nitrolancea hollandica Lb TaxID=1129897 RepID=I4EIC0_9BACT|nr:hypothetical protein NITHO_3400016 [Nitrolancea hollandica Lb]
MNARPEMNSGDLPAGSIIGVLVAVFDLLLLLADLLPRLAFQFFDVPLGLGGSIPGQLAPGLLGLALDLFGFPFDLLLLSVSHDPSPCSRNQSHSLYPAGERVALGRYPVVVALRGL